MRALVIGNSDGIGLALTRRLLDAGWTVAGISRSSTPDMAQTDRYTHHVVDVRADGYPDVLRRACAELGTIDVCVYCVGVGQEIDLDQLTEERPVFEINLLGAVTTLEVVLPIMLAVGRGHVIGLSSQADRVRDPFAPSYAASKAGLSAYLEALDKVVRKRGVAITNVRFGFVDTKMAKSEIRPFLMSADRAARLIERGIRKRPRTLTRPRRMAFLLFFVRLFS